MSTVRYSFIIVSYNTVELTLAALRSIRRLAAGFSHEVILVDNGSRDGTVGKVETDFPEVKCFVLSENRGFAAANNAGATAASGEWLVLMNSDAELLPDTMSQLDRTLEKHPETGVLGGQLLNSDDTLQSSVYVSEPIRHFEEAHQNEEIVKVDSVVGAFMVVRHTLWRQLNGMDEGFFFYFEESDFCWRAAQAGATVRWTPRFRVRHHGGASSGKANPKARVEYYTSLYHHWGKRMSSKLFARQRQTMTLKIASNVATNSLGCLITLFLLPSLRKRLNVYSYLLAWHWRGCPAGWGLRPKAADESLQKI